jgi:hypothetical protein
MRPRIRYRTARPFPRPDPALQGARLVRRRLEVPHYWSTAAATSLRARPAGRGCGFANVFFAERTKPRPAP